MDLKPVSDFFSNIKDKITNPFFGTLIIVWLTRNWELIYTLFNFDKTSKLNTKITFIKTYWENKDFQDDLIASVLQSIILLVLGYGVIAITRSLSLVLEYNVMPWLTNVIINKNVVLKSDYDTLSIERDNYFQKYESEKNSLRNISNQLDSLQNNFNKNIKNYSDLTKKYDDLNKLYEKEREDNSDNERLINSLKNDLASKINQFESTQKAIKNSLNIDFNDNDKQIINHLIFSDKKYQNFILSALTNDNKISKTIPKDLISFRDYFKTFLGLLEWTNYINENYDDKLILSDDGVKLLKFIKLLLIIKGHERL